MEALSSAASAALAAGTHPLCEESDLRSDMSILACTAKRRTRERQLEGVELGGADGAVGRTLMRETPSRTFQKVDGSARGD